MKCALAKKVEMSQMFDEKGSVIPLTKVKLYNDLKVTAILNAEKNGYNAVQIGAEFKKKFKDSLLPKIKREFRLTSENLEIKVGDSITIGAFALGDKLNVTGVSKGKGFAGAMKRHNFHGADATHGTKHAHRQVGSIGAGYPEHVMKGKRMPGRMGSDQVTLKNIKIVGIDAEDNTLYLKGAIPGHRNSILKLILA